MASLLVVEDDAPTARAVARALRAAGHTPVVVASSCAAARSIEESFDCGVLDIELGDGCGLDLAQELVTKGTVESVIFHTGASESQVGERARQLGGLVLKAEPAGRLLAEIARATAKAT